jgi:hypothetical protein
MKKKNLMFLCLTLVLLGIIITEGHAAAEPENTTLFITLDAKWNYADPGDTFVIRTDVKNIGEHPALLVWVHLHNIPDDWSVYPSHQLILLLQPGQTKSRFFVTERGPTDATIYATAHGYNAPLVSSNRIAIPISVWVLAAFSVVCCFVLYRQASLHRQPGGVKPKKPVRAHRKLWR